MSDVEVSVIPVDTDLFDVARRHLQRDDSQVRVVDDHARQLEARHDAQHQGCQQAFSATSEGAFAGYALMGPAATNGDRPLELVITTTEAETTSVVIRALLETCLRSADAPVVWWTRQPLTLFALATTAQLGGRTFRKVDRMNRELSPDDDAVATPTRPFTWADTEELLRINNEAFSGHPERGDLSRDALEQQLALLEGHLECLLMTDGGFCWTKNDEIYVLGVDNTHQGRGAGKGLLHAGLSHVRQQHNTSLAYLYVEHSNMRARALYQSSGFVDAREPLTAFRFGN